MGRWRTEYTPDDNHSRATVMSNGGGGGVQKPPFNVAVQTTGRLCGHYFTLSATVDLKHLATFAERLTSLGFTSPPEPLTFQLTAEGLPICPKHRVPMKRRDKQKDTWHSHQLTDSDGRVFYCRGYAGPGSEGYDLDMPDPIDA